MLPLTDFRDTCDIKMSIRVCIIVIKQCATKKSERTSLDFPHCTLFLTFQTTFYGTSPIFKMELFKVTNFRYHQPISDNAYFFFNIQWLSSKIRKIG